MVQSNTPDLKPNASEMNVANNTAREVQRLAKTIAGIMATNPDITVQFQDDVSAKERVKMSPMTWLFLLRETFDENPNANDLTLADFPVPETEEKDVVGTNRQPDKYASFIPSPTGSGITNEKGSFYNDLFKDTVYGAEVHRQLEGYKLAAANAFEIPPDFIWARGSKDAEDRVQLYTTRRDTGRRMIKDAMRVYFQMSMIAELFGNKVEVTFKAGPTPDGKVRISPDTAKPIIVGKMGDNRAFTDMAVTEFLKLQPKNCLMANPDAGYEELMMFHKIPRATSESELDKVVPKNLAGVMTYMRALGMALAPASDRSIYRDVLKEFSGKDAPEKIKAFGDAYLEILGIWDSVRLRYDQYIAAEARELDAKVAASKEAKKSA